MMIIAAVRSLRLTDATWKSWGIAAECLGLSRADLLENFALAKSRYFSLYIFPKTNIKD